MDARCGALVYWPSITRSAGSGLQTALVRASRLLCRSLGYASFVPGWLSFLFECGVWGFRGVLSMIPFPFLLITLHSPLLIFSAALTASN